MKISITSISERQWARFLIYKNQIKLLNVFIYKKGDTFQKAIQFSLCFIYKMPDNLCYSIFHGIFEVVIYIQKAWLFLLRDVFIYKKSVTLQKARQFPLRFALRNFTLNFWYRWRVGLGIFLHEKKMHFALHFFIKNNLYFKKRIYAFRFYMKEKSLCNAFYI